MGEGIRREVKRKRREREGSGIVALRVVFCNKREGKGLSLRGKEWAWGGFIEGSKAMLDGAIKLKNKVGPTVVHAS